MKKYFLEKTQLLGRGITISSARGDSGTFSFKYYYCGSFCKTLFIEENPLRGKELKIKRVR